MAERINVMENIDIRMMELAERMAAKPPGYFDCYDDDDEYECDDDDCEDPNEPLWLFWRDRL